MLQGLPDVVAMASGDSSAAHVMTTSIPHGAWEVRFVEVDADTASITVTLHQDETARATDEDTTAPLRCVRSFLLPEDANLMSAVDAEVDESDTLKVTIPRSAGASKDVDASQRFHFGVDETAGPAPMQANRAARRRAKQEGLKAGFLNKQRRNKARKENEPD